MVENEEQARINQSLQYDSDSDGALMSKDMVVVRDNNSINQVLTNLRRARELPSPNDKSLLVNAALAN